MKQLGLGLNLSTKKTRKREFLDQMDRVVPWSALVQVVEPYYPKAKTGHPPFPIESMLRIHYLQQWFALSDPAMEEALQDMPIFREFAELGEGLERLPDESTILRPRTRRRSSRCSRCRTCGWHGGRLWEFKDECVRRARIGRARRGPCDERRVDRAIDRLGSLPLRVEIKLSATAAARIELFRPSLALWPLCDVPRTQVSLGEETALARRCRRGVSRDRGNDRP